MSRVDPYSPSELVKQLHELPHYDFDFTPVSNEFAPDDMRYLQSLAQFALPFLVGSVVTLLVVCCCRRRGAKGDMYNTTKQQRTATLTFIAVGIVAVLITGVYLLGNQNVSDGVNQFLDSISAVQDVFDTFFAKVRLLDSSINTSLIELGNATVPQQVFDDVNSTLITAQDFVHVILDNADSLRVDSISGTINQGDDKRWLGFTIFGACLGVAAFGYLYIRNNRVGSPKCLVLSFGTLVAFLAFMAAGVCMMISVGVADFCASPNENILSLVATGDGTAAQVARFYIECPPGETNPLLDDITNASAAVNESLASLDGVPDVEALREAITNTRDVSNEVEASSGCEALNAAYVGAVNALCSPALTGLFLVLCCAGIAALLLTAAAAVALRRGTPQDAYEPLVSTPLFGPDAKKRSDPLVFDDPAMSPYYGSTSRGSSPRKSSGVRVEG
eukprot:m.66846 g.66846  ORF g.66846 m.66846 type:complete len:447 (+) comp8391_c1_seq2:59-1399(+)